MASTLVTVVETASFAKDADRILTEKEHRELIDTLAAEPEAGVLIPGGGGIRKLRVGFGGRGKRGGARVIYFYHSERMPVFALALFAKNERSDLTQSEIKALAKVMKETAKHYGC